MVTTTTSALRACTTRRRARGQHASLLGQDHPREAPPVGDAAGKRIGLSCGRMMSPDATPGKSLTLFV
jgi:hypothetical protein